MGFERRFKRVNGGHGPVGLSHSLRRLQPQGGRVQTVQPSLFVAINSGFLFVIR